MDLVEKEIVPMKKNLKSNIAQKGGLMIEALAMLGLIAVVTPTMYKKSAERALEVEDINTADTVRSYMGATEAYMAANYRNLIKQMTEKVEDDGTITPINVTTKQVSWGDIKSYMPYGFDNDKALYDYDSPKIAIWRDGTNLTAYALFPAKGTGGLGQERTSRIASLIGANGGYTKSDKSAHGIGGVWNLSADDVKEAFGSNDNNEFSLITASSNVINSTSGAGAVENTKYLQRTAENTGEEWRNTMRTDLYMGGGDDNKINDPDSKDTGNHNIVNINSLIVGADKDINEYANNGLYIAPSWTDKEGKKHENTKINAYIAGTLTALSDQFLVGKDDKEKGFVYFGDTNASKNNDQYPFRIAESGKVTTVGDINLANANQASEEKKKVVANIGSYGATTDDIEINGTEASDLTNPHLFHGEVDKDTDGNPYVSVSLLSEEMFKMTSDNKEIENDVDNVSGTHVMIEENGYRGADADKNADKEDEDKVIDSLGNEISPNYETGQIFPVVIGSNAMVKGVMSAGQVDAQVLRTAALTTGSEHIDDQFKWLEVDKDGIQIRDPQTTTADEEGVKTTTGIQGYIKKDLLEFKSGNDDNDDNDDNDAIIRMQRNKIGTVKVGEEDKDVYGGNVDISGQHVKMVTNDSTNGTATVRNANMGMQIQNRDLTIGVKEDGSEILSADNSDISSNQYRVVIGRGGNVDMVGSNLKIMNNDDESILTVKGNSNAETTSKFGSGMDMYNDFNTYNSVTVKPDYNIVTHGNILFGSMNEKDATEINSNNYANYAGAKFVAIGPDDEDAGVNIVEAKKESNKLAKEVNDNRVLFVDLSKKDNKAHVNTNEADDYELAVDDTSIGNSLEDHKMQAGTVYVRKGLVEVVPNPTDRQKDTNTGRSKIGANDGSGIIRASRFVANNINKDGKEEKVLDILNGGVLDKYNGSGTVKYDTYMVNPAYTSVMKDIKLTTRGGARLSDILPDFISKGIYLASNTFDDAKQEMRFTLKDDGSFKLADEPAETPACVTDDNGKCKYTKNNWASPYSGLVPAPQCPPGYGRVITITPYRFEMAQAGQLALSEDAGTGQVGDAGNAGYYVNTLDMASKLKRASYSGSNKEDLENELLAVQPAPRTLNVAWNNGSVKISSIKGKVTKENESAAINIESGSGEMGIDKATGMEVYAEILQGSTDYDSQPEEDGYGYKDVAVPTTYVISSGVYKRGTGESATATYPMSPLVFQQSTWLHTEAVPVVPSGAEPGTGTYVGYNPDGKYVRGWAVLQGFLYHYNEYKNFACSSGSCKELSPISDTDENEVLWNLFPVAKNSLGSYVTTYCYFDRLNQWGNFIPVDTEGSETSKLIEQFDVLNEIPTDYVKGRTTSAGTSSMELKRKTYYENLNDPTMKYNEVW